MKHHAKVSMARMIAPRVWVSDVSCVDCEWVETNTNDVLNHILVEQHNEKDVEFVHRVNIDAIRKESWWHWMAYCGDCSWRMAFTTDVFTEIFDRAHVHSHRMNRAQNVLRTA